MASDHFQSPTSRQKLVCVIGALMVFAQLHAVGKSVEEIKRLLTQGLQQREQNQHDPAIQTFSAALELKPDAKTAAELHGQRGGAYLDKGAVSEAMADTEMAVRLAPRYFRGYQVRARVYLQRKQFDRALHDINTAMKLAPHFGQLYNNRGNIFVAKDQRKRAIQDFSEAIRRDPEAIDGYVNRGGSYAIIGECDKAIIDLNRALQINLKDSYAYYNRGLAYECKRNYHLALADFSKANELAPRDPDTLNWIAWLKATCPHDVLRNGKEALTASLEACQLTSFKDAAYLDTLAAAYAEAGDFVQAIQTMTKAMKMKIDAENRKGFEKRLALYRERKPYRDTERRVRTRR